MSEHRRSAQPADRIVFGLHLEALGVRLSELTEEQADYLGVPVAGPFKTELYRY